MLFGLVLSAGEVSSQVTPLPILKSERFDKDPGWEGYNNHVVPKNVLMVKQDFGYAKSNFAGKAAGEMGGVIQRSTTPASYAAKIVPQTLDDELTASGSFAITATQPGAGVFFGFFNSQQPGGSGRPIGSLGMHFDFEGTGGRLAVRLITGGNKSRGTFITPYLPGKFRPTPLKKDGTKYHWTLAYHPQAAAGNGEFTFTLASDTHKQQDYGSLPELAEKEAQARFPNTTTFTVDLPPGYRKEGATFDRFGMLNMMKAGGTATMFFDDLQFNGQSQDFSHDPQWVGTGNRVTFEDREQVGAHDFGYSAATRHAGGKAGEVGGGLWRSGNFGYYADRVGPLNLQQRMEARGKVRLVTAGPDSDMYLGWFNSASKDKNAGDETNFVGIHVGGPTRIGHYFIPVCGTAKGTRAKVDRGPVLTPGMLFEWSLVYEPTASNGNGEMRVTLGKESVTLTLKKGQKAEDATLDRFGLFTSTAGGQMVKIYLDDLSYTASAFRGDKDTSFRTLDGHSGSVLAVAFSPDGKTLVSGSRDATIKYWDTATGALLRTLTDQTGDVYDIAFSPDGEMLASGGKDNGIKLRDAQSGQVIRTLEGHTDIVRSIAFSPDGKTLASSSVDLTVRLWDVATGKLLHTLTGHTLRVMSVSFSPDGTTVASASSDKTARLWDAKTGEMKLLLEGDSGGLEHLEYSPDGNSLVGSSHDANVRIWDVATGKVRLTLAGHTEEVDCCAFSPDGQTVVSGSKDTTLKFWDAETGKLLRTLAGHTGRVESLTFSPDGQTLATGGGGGDTSVRLWDVKR